MSEADLIQFWRIVSFVLGGISSISFCVAFWSGR